MNLQNLVRDATKSKLRTSLTPPSGFKIVTADSSQIEARLVAQLCGQIDLSEAFRNGVDVYADFASNVFGQTVTKKEQPNHRFIGKVGVLSLGYGCGAERFYRMVITQARQYGIVLDGLFDEGVAEVTVNTYRTLFDRIPAMWRDLDRLLRLVLMNDCAQELQLGPIILMPRRIYLPNGLFLRYDDPTEELWGGKLLENIPGSSRSRTAVCRTHWGMAPLHLIRRRRWRSRSPTGTPTSSGMWRSGVSGSSGMAPAGAWTGPDRCSR